MRFKVFFIFALITHIYAQEAKIVLGTFDTKKKASEQLTSFNKAITPYLLQEQKNQNFKILARESGKYFIVTIEPIRDIKTAQKIRKKLPKPFSSIAFVGNYTTIKNTQKKNQEKNNSLNAKSIKEDVNITITKPSFYKEANKTSNVLQKEKTQASKNDVEDIKQVEKNITISMSIIQDKKENTYSDVNNSTIKIDNNVNQVEKIIQKEKNTTSLSVHVTNVNENEEKNNTIESNMTIAPPGLSDDKKIKPDFSNNIENQKRKNGWFDLNEPLNIQITQATNYLLAETKKCVLDITRTLKNSFMQFNFEISVIFFLTSLLLFFLAYKKSFYLSRKIKRLKEKNHEKVKQIEALKTDMSNLRGYFDDIIASIKSPLKVLQEHFKLKDISAEDKNAQEAINGLSTAIRSYENFGGNIVLNQKEFDLNALIKKVFKSSFFKCSAADVCIDFNSTMLKNVVGDSEKIGTVIKILAEICCSKENKSRILVVLSEATQDIEGSAFIKIIIKNSKATFIDGEIDKIQDILDENEHVNSSLYDEKLLEIVTAKRILESMHGKIQVLKNIKQERGFIFDLKLNVVNRRLIQKNLFSNKSPLQLGIIIFGNNAESVKTLQSELEFLSLDIKTCFSWNQLADDLNNIYVFIDIVIIQNVTLPFVDVAILNKASKRKNFINVIIVDENESQSKELRQIQNKRVLKKPYEKEALPHLLETLSEELRPNEPNS